MIEIYKNTCLENIDGEIWKDIIGYEGLYQISNLGRVKSLSRKTMCRWGKNQLRKERIKKQSFDSNGYLHIMLHNDGVRKMWLSQQLVGIHFIYNPENKPQVNHIKGVRTDNRVSELEWNTSKENINHSFNVLKRIPNTTGKFGKDHVASKEVECCTLGITFPSLTIAAESLGVKGANITMVCRNIRRHTQGLVFRYV